MAIMKKVGRMCLSFVMYVSNVLSLLGRPKMAYNVQPLLVSCELRNELFSVKDKNSCET